MSFRHPLPDSPLRPFGRRLLRAAVDAEALAARNARPLTSSVTLVKRPRAVDAAEARDKELTLARDTE